MSHDRQCESCHVCCVVLPVEDLNKPELTRCEHLQVLDQPNGCGACGIYQQRPSSCQQYKCSWLDGLLGDDLRPDQCGLLFETAQLVWPKPLSVLMGFECEPGAFERSQDLLADSLQPGVIALAVPHGRQGETLICAYDRQDFEAYKQWEQAVREQGHVRSCFHDGEVVMDLSDGSITRHQEDPW